jgi:hypothetical protein
MNFSVWSQSFISDTIDLSVCNVDESTWLRIHDENSEAKRIFAKITLGLETVYCALGNPVRAPDIESEYPHLFLPPTIISSLNADGVGDAVTVEWIQEESFPEATKIILRPHDSAFYHADAKEELERCLTQVGVLKEGTIIQVKITELGGFEMYFDVVKTEPANVVLMQGDEVAIEFMEAMDEAPMSYMSSPTSLPQEEFKESEPMVPTALVAPEQKTMVYDGGYTLGGATKPRLPDGRAWNPWR